MDDLTKRICNQNQKRLSTLLIVTCFFVLVSSSIVGAQEASRIWSPQIDVPAAGESGAEVFYRKRFSLVNPEKAELQIAAGDEYEVYINGQIVARGQSFSTKSVFDVSESMVPGINTVAAKVRHVEGPTPGLALRLRVKEESEIRYRSLVSNGTWKTYPYQSEGWQNSRFNDMVWLDANVIDSAEILSLSSTTAKVAASETESDSNQIVVLDRDASRRRTDEPVVEQKRFEIDPEFQIDQILTDEEVGSIVAMEYDEFGRIYLSQETGGLLIADPSLQPGDPNRVRSYCDEVKAIQGILPLNGKVYVTGMGRDGQALYLLGERNGKITVLDTIVEFTGQPNEHGAHGVKLGKDGMLYVILGNATSAKGRIFGSSPFKNA